MNGPEGLYLRMKTTRFEKSLFLYTEEPKTYILEAAHIVLTSSITTTKCWSQNPPLRLRAGKQKLFLNKYSTTLWEEHK